MMESSFSYIYDNSTRDAFNVPTNPFQASGKLKKISSSANGKRTLVHYKLTPSELSAIEIQDFALKIACGYISSNSAAELNNNFTLEPWVSNSASRRMGDFGEMLTSVIYRHVYNSIIPIYKLRNKSSSESTLQGVDVFAIKYNNLGGFRPVEIEVKTRSARISLGTLRKAIESGNTARSTAEGAWKLAAVHLLNSVEEDRLCKALILDDDFMSLPPLQDTCLISSSFSSTFKDWKKLDEIWPDGSNASRLTLIEIPNLASFSNDVFSRVKALTANDVARGVILPKAFSSLPMAALQSKGSSKELEKVLSSMLLNKSLPPQDVKNLIDDAGSGLWENSSMTAPILWEYYGYHANACIAITKLNIKEFGLIDKLVLFTLQGKISSFNKIQDWGIYSDFCATLLNFWKEGIGSQDLFIELEKIIEDLTIKHEFNAVVLLVVLSSILKKTVASSPWILINRASQPNSSTHTLIKKSAYKGFTSLWPSQIKCIQEGVLDFNAKLVTIEMPTNTGKTFLTKLLISTALDETPGIAVALVPTRVLAEEMRQDLRDLSLPLITEVATGEGQEPFCGPTNGGINKIFTMTPEAFNIRCLNDELYTSTTISSSINVLQTASLFPSQEAFLEKLRILVVDEAHLLEDESRGLTLEILLSRLRKRFPNLKIVLLSSRLPSAEDLHAWLKSSQEGALSEHASLDWRPTILNKGIHYAEGGKGVLVYDHEPEVERQIVEIRKGRHKEDLILKLSDDIVETYGTSLSDLTVAAALKFLKDGMVLIYTGKKDYILNLLAAQIKYSNWLEWAPEPNAHVKLLRNATIKELKLIDPASSLIESLSVGVACHHGDMHPAVQKLIVNLAKAGGIDLLISTSTLSEGVNLPVKTVFVHNIYSHIKNNREGAVLQNLSGRAARAFRHIEGTVIISAIDKPSALKMNRELAKERIPLAASSIKVFIESLRGNRLLEGSFGDALASQSLLLLLEEFSGTGDELALKFLKSTLWWNDQGVTNEQKESLTRALGYAINKIKTKNLSDKDYLVYAQTAFSIETCELISQYLDQEWEMAFDAIIKLKLSRKNNDFISFAIDLVCNHEILFKFFIKDDKLKMTLKQAILLWLDGAKEEEINTFLIHHATVLKTQELLNKVYSTLPWLVEGIRKIALNKISLPTVQQFDEEKAISLRIKNGLRSDSALYLHEWGLSRENCNSISKKVEKILGDGHASTILSIIEDNINLFSSEEIASLQENRVI